VGDLVSEIEKVMAEGLGEAAPAAYEIILVNDGSPDESWSVIEKLAGSQEHVRGINLMRNFGQHNALLCGIRAARYDHCVTLDDDLQHPPAEVGNMLKVLEPGVDVVYGANAQSVHGLLRGLASMTIKWALKRAMGVKSARHASAFRLFRTHLREAFREFDGPHANMDALLSWGTRNFDVCKVQHRPRKAGQSNYSAGKLFKHAIIMVTSFTTLPLKLATWIGFSSTIFGLGALAWVFAMVTIYGRVVPGWAFLASLVAILSGAQLFSMGIFGEYLAQIHRRTSKQPTYVVEASRGGSKDHE
jgi:undecaprenyl-phosphate 4-deoxy-4-formamido-L-arabinose transferase